jgi:hypothetical protein
MVSLFAKRWNKIFIVEIGAGIPYPEEKQRWRKYGEPLSQLFTPYFFGEKIFQWFKDDSGNFLEGVNVACFESSSKWKEPQNEQKDIELFACLFAPINDFFVKLGSWAAITGLSNIEKPFFNSAVEAVNAKFSSTFSVFYGQLPVEFDEPDLRRQAHMIKHNERYFIVYIGKQTGCKRFREVAKEQAKEIEKSDANQFWKEFNGV